MRVGIDYIGGYRFNNCLYAGAGVGLNVDTWGNWDYFTVSTHTLHEVDDDWRYSIRNMYSIPVYAHFRAYMGKKRCQPFAALSAGAHVVFPTSSVQVEISYSGCVYDAVRYNSTYFFIEPMAGMDVRINQRISVSLQVGLNLHGVSYMKMKDAQTLKALQYPAVLHASVITRSTVAMLLKALQFRKMLPVSGNMHFKIAMHLQI